MNGFRPWPTQHDYDNAMASQSASNASGLIHELADVSHRVWNEVNDKGGGSQQFAEHPIIRFYVYQLAWLCWHALIEDHGEYSKMYDLVTKGMKNEMGNAGQSGQPGDPGNSVG